MNRIVKKFEDLRKKGKKAFIPFISLGYPDIDTCMQLVFKLEQSGADIIELGIPFSDPLADGPVIQTASFEALNNGGVNLERAIEFVARVREKTSVPVVFMGYYNPLFRFGEERFTRLASQAGVDGLIVADLPPEEAENLGKYIRKEDMASIFLLTPISSDERIKLVCTQSTGFIYCVSYTGVTGAKGKREQEHMLSSLVEKVRFYCDTPVGIGFGISSPSEAKKASSLADGVIVGSAIIRNIMENKHNKHMLDEVGKFALSLSQAIK